MFSFIGGLKAAAWQVLAFLVAVGLIIGFFTWAFNNKQTFTAVAGSVGNAGASVVIGTADWIAEQAGGSPTSSNAAHAGPETIWVEKDASAVRWPVGRAVVEWNRGLTSVKLRVGKCHDGAECIKVSQAELYTPEGQSLVLGKTQTLFGKRVKLNAAAVGHVPASYLQFAACHELGHALGLEHRSALTSCMHASAKGAATRPDRTDFARVNAEYGH
jgi:Matrixin